MKKLFNFIFGKLINIFSRKNKSAENKIMISDNINELSDHEKILKILNKKSSIEEDINVDDELPDYRLLWDKLEEDGFFEHIDPVEKQNRLDQEKINIAKKINTKKLDSGIYSKSIHEYSEVLEGEKNKDTFELKKQSMKKHNKR